MKNTAIVTIVLVLLFSTETNFAQLFTGGVSLGFGGSQIDGDTWSGYHKLNPLIGIFVESKEFMPKANVLIETSFLTKGSRELDKNTSYLYKIPLQYVQLRLLFQYKIYKDYYAASGISPALLINYGVSENGVQTPKALLNFRYFDIPVCICLGKRINKTWKASFMFSYSSFSIRPEAGFWNNEAIFTLNRYISI